MSDFTLNTQGIQPLHHMNTSKSQPTEEPTVTSKKFMTKEDIEELDAKVQAEQNRYTDNAGIASQNTPQSLGKAKSSVSLTEIETDLTGLKFNGQDGVHSVLDNYYPLELSAQNNASLPHLLEHENEGTANVQLMEGTFAEWPPKRADFVHPTTGEKSQGYYISVSTGEDILVPEGQSLFMQGKSFLHGDQVVYTIDQHGNTNENYPQGRTR